MTIESVTLGQIVTAFAVLMAISKGLEWVINPFKKSNADLSALKKKVDDHDKQLSDIHDFMYTSLTATKALLKHGIDGNDVQAMKDAADDIDDYLMSKKVRSHS